MRSQPAQPSPCRPCPAPGQPLWGTHCPCHPIPWGRQWLCVGGTGVRGPSPGLTIALPGSQAVPLLSAPASFLPGALGIPTLAASILEPTHGSMPHRPWDRDLHRPAAAVVQPPMTLGSPLPHSWHPWPDPCPWLPGQHGVCSSALDEQIQPGITPGTSVRSQLDLFFSWGRLTARSPRQS